jgi:glycosyltransferase involved in cell wall biosynthesis
MTVKVIHLITDLDPGGAELSLYRLLSGLSRERFENIVISMIPPGSVGERIQRLGVEVISLQMEPGRISIRGLGRMVRLLRERRPAILQTWLYHADLLGLCAAALAGVRTVVWNIRSSYIDLSKYRKLSSLVIRLCALFSFAPAGVVVNSMAGQEYHQQIGYRPRRWAYIPNGIDTDRFHPDPAARDSVRAELGLPRDAFLVGMLARFDPMKDHAGFLAAAAEFIRSGGEASFLLAGREVTNKNPELAKAVESLGLNAYVHLLGHREDVPRLAAALDVLALTSRGEGFPNVLGEAMACGVPCVATAVGDAELLVGETGRIVPVGDPHAMAQAWAEMNGLGTVMHARIGQEARRRVVENFSLEAMASQYEKLYLEILSPSESTVCVE